MSGFARRRVSSVGGFASTVLRGNQKQWSARWGHLIQIVERRFLCFVSLSPLDKEMKCRHAQWLIVIKNIANIEPALTSAAATRRRPSPPDIEMKCRHAQWLIVIKNIANIAPALTSAAP